MSLSRPVPAWKVVAAAAGVAVGVYATVHLAKWCRKLGVQRALLSKYKKSLQLPLPLLKQIQEDFHQQMLEGLSKQGASSLLMLPAFVTQLPDGSETGEYYAIDLGGTNFRTLYVKLGEEKGIVDKEDIQEYSIPSNVYRGTGQQLFDYLAAKLVEFIKKHQREDGGTATPPVVGFCFSFPTEQTSVASGKLLQWTKGFTCEGVVGEDPVALLSSALERAGRPCKVAVLINDTVGVVAGKRYFDPCTEVGVIVGTGTNMCYVEKVSEVKKWKAEGIDPEALTAINVESGGFKTEFLPLTQEDKQLDDESTNRGAYQFEKCVSGKYLGEVLRLILLRFAKEVELFGPKVPPALEQSGSITTAMLSYMESDSTPWLSDTKYVLVNALRLDPLLVSYSARKLVAELCRLLALRSSRLVAASLLGVLQRVGFMDQPRRLVVAVDGGVYEHYTRYRSYLRLALEELLSGHSKDVSSLIVLEPCRDSSSLGAAFLAASASAQTA